MEAANYGILSLIPLALTLLLAFWKKDAVFALFMGCLSGVLLLGHDPAFGFSALAEEALGNEDFIWILLIQVFIGIMIAFFMKAGVVKAFAEMIAGKVKSPRSVKLATWFIGLFTIDDYMSPLLRGVVMRPLTDEMRVPREKLAFILDSTCASVCTLMPFMAWGAYVAGLVADLGGPVTSNEQGVSVYISAIPFNFYAILMVLITLLSALEIFPDFGPMRKAEQRARTTGKLLRDGAVPMMGTELEELQKGNDSDVKPNVMLDFLVPIMILVGTAIWTYIAKGGVKILECFIITVIYMAIELSIRKVFKSVTDLVSTAVQGMKSVHVRHADPGPGLLHQHHHQVHGRRRLPAGRLRELDDPRPVPVCDLHRGRRDLLLHRLLLGHLRHLHSHRCSHGLLLHWRSAGYAGLRRCGRRCQRRSVRRPLLPRFRHLGALLSGRRLRPH